MEAIDPGLEKPDSNGEEPEQKESPGVVAKQNWPAGLGQSEALAHEIKVKEYAEQCEQMKREYYRNVQRRQFFEHDLKHRQIDERI